MPFVTMIAGPNGSGKSTLIASLLESGVDLGEYLNADDIARDMVVLGEPSRTSPALGSAAISQAAQVEVRDRRDRAMAERRDHSFETVMSHPSHIAYLADARAAGFTVVLYFVATDDPRINVGRVANRVARGGHAVPADRIVARYHRCLANLPAASAVADGGGIFDNGNPADPLRLLARIEKGSVVPFAPPADYPLWWQDALDNLR